MPRTLVLSALLFPFAAAAAPTLSVDGACPGDGAIDISGATGPWVAVLYGHGTGSETASLGPCGDVATGLSDIAGRRYVRVDDGAASFTPSFPDAICDGYVQVVDVGDCSATAAVPISDDGAPVRVLLHATPVVEGGGVSGDSDFVAYTFSVGGYWYYVPCGDGMATLDVDLYSGGVGTYSWSAGDDEFDDAAVCLADGIEQEIGFEISFPGAGGSVGSIGTETYFLGGAPDLYGYTVTEIRFVADLVDVYVDGGLTWFNIEGTWEFWGD